MTKQSLVRDNNNSMGMNGWLRKHNMLPQLDVTVLFQRVKKADVRPAFKSSHSKPSKQSLPHTRHVAGAIKPPSATHIPFKNAKRQWLFFSIPQQPQLYYSNSVIPDSLRGKYLHRGVLTSAFNCMVTSSRRFNLYFWHNISFSVQKLNLV